MALNPNAIVTLAQAKDFLGIETLDTSQDTKVELLINAGSERFEKHCDRKFITQTYTEYHDGRRGNSLVLRHFPASQPSAVYDDPSWTFGADTLVDSTTYTVEKDNVLRLKSSYFSPGNQNIKVTYQAGLGTLGTLPSDLVLACLLYVQFMYNVTNNNSIGLQSKSKGGESISYIDGLPKHIAEMLEPYVRSEFALSGGAIRNG